MLILAFLVLMYVADLLPTQLMEILAPFPGSQILIVLVVYFVTGLTKGFSGVGTALISVPLVSLMYDPVLAVSLVIVPLIITNFHQGIIAGNVKETLSGYGLLAGLMMVGMTLTAYWSTGFSPDLIKWAIGLSAIGFVVVKTGFKPPVIPDQYDRLAQAVTGCVAGFLGGLTGLVVIPVVIYLMMRNVKKERFIAVSGIMFLISGIALLLGHLMNQTLTQSSFLLSTLVAAPALAGILMAESKRHWISEELFRKVMLLLVFVIGSKIIVLQLL